MPKYQIFGNKQVLEPGAYSQIKGGDKKAPAGISTGKVLIIDTGTGAGFGGGAGSLGTKYQGKKSIYSFDNLDDFRNWMRGGLLWDIAKRVFIPSKSPNVNGAQQLMIIQARETTPAIKSLTIGTVSGGSPNGGTLAFGAYAEGVGANGVLNSTSNDLQVGFAVKMVKSALDDTMYQFQFYVGTYCGLDENGAYINNVAPENAVSKLLFTSDPFNTVAGFKNYFLTNMDFEAAGFYLNSSTIFGAGAVTNTDLTAFSSLQLFAGGTETYSTEALDEAIESIQEIDNVYFLADKYGTTNGIGVENTKIFTAMTTEGIYQRMIVIGGGGDRAHGTQLSASSANMAAYYNSGYAFICHDIILEKNAGNTPGFRELSPLYFAATVVGKMAGNPPQKSITWEDIDVDGVPELLKLSERNILLKKGVIHIKEVADSLVVNQEVTTLQQNDQYVYPNGECPDGSLMRISAILNKTIKQKLEQRFVGSNQNLSSPSDVQSYVETILGDSTATKNADNLIISFQDVKVHLTGSDYNISYGFTPNGPINRLFVTGFMFSPNISI